MDDIYVYDITTDSSVLVTQEWCDKAALQLNLLARHRNIIRAISKLNIVHDKSKIDQIDNFLNTIGVI